MTWATQLAIKESLWKVGAYKQLSVKGKPIHEVLAPMNGKNRLLVTDEPAESEK